jgi:hypothetical protein
MYDKVINYLSDTSWYAQAGLVIFAVVFVGVSLRAILTPKRDVSRWAGLPLDDKF